MNFSPEETQQAAAQGWGVYEIYDLQKNMIVLELMPHDLSRTSQAELQQHIVQAAKSGNALAIKALTVVAHFNLQRKKK